jgi:dTDP-4-amino-4,6-dideoxygalactose transaminase
MSSFVKAAPIGHISFLDLQAAYRALAADGIEDAILESLRNAQFIQSVGVQSFEQHWAEYCGTAQAIAVDSGTAALKIAMTALDIGSGDEVIVPAHTFIATAAAVALCGARPVFVDADPVHWQMDVESVTQRITARTKAIVAVHLFGQPCDLDPLSELCRTRGILLIEDAAQAQGARYKGRRVGSIGAAGCFSFYPAKNLGAFGDAGAITTDSAQLASRMRRLSNHGRVTKYEHAEVGENLRMDEIQGIALNYALTKLDAWNARRRQIAAVYRERLNDLPLFLPESLAGTEPVHHLFPIASARRDDLAAFLLAREVDSGIHYPLPLHLQPAFLKLGYHPGDLPVAERIGREELSLPIGPFMSDAQVERVCEVVREFHHDA